MTSGYYHLERELASYLELVNGVKDSDPETAISFQEMADYYKRCLEELRAKNGAGRDERSALPRQRCCW